jgi:acetamidase/formamidase
VAENKHLPFMRIEKPNSIIAVQAARPLELAVDTATRNLMTWLIEEHGITPSDAYCLVSACPDFRINVYQMVNMAKLSFVAGAEIPRKYLSSD